MKATTLMITAIGGSSFASVKTGATLSGAETVDNETQTSDRGPVVLFEIL